MSPLFATRTSTPEACLIPWFFCRMRQSEKIQKIDFLLQVETMARNENERRASEVVRTDTKTDCISGESSNAVCSDVNDLQCTSVPHPSNVESEEKFWCLQGREKCLRINNWCSRNFQLKQYHCCLNMNLVSCMKSILFCFHYCIMAIRNYTIPVYLVQINFSRDEFRQMLEP